MTWILKIIDALDKAFFPRRVTRARRRDLSRLQEVNDRTESMGSGAV